MHRWVKALDVKMGIQKRYICLLIDNFSGHKISFAPRNIQIIFFEPNLTSFVQPLDAGIIRCFKALRLPMCTSFNFENFENLFLKIDNILAESIQI